MRINTRFPVAVHMLALTAMLQKRGIPITSDLLAQSVGTNPVVIRQMMSLLRKAGLIETKSGTPGCRVVKEEREIPLLDIYKAVHLFMHIIPTPGPLTMYCQAVTFFPRFLHFLP